MMNQQKQIESTKHIAAILRQRGSRLADAVMEGLDVRNLPRHIREKVVDELGEEFSAKGLKNDHEPNAYGLEIEALTVACGLTWDDIEEPKKS
jgi:hypothetical protein